MLSSIVQEEETVSHQVRPLNGLLPILLSDELASAVAKVYCSVFSQDFSTVCSRGGLLRSASTWAGRTVRGSFHLAALWDSRVTRLRALELASCRCPADDLPRRHHNVDDCASRSKSTLISCTSFCYSHDRFHFANRQAFASGGSARIQR